MWIQVRTIEWMTGTCSPSYSREAELENGYTLFDYDVGLNDIIQLLVRPDPDHLPGTSTQIEAKPCSNSPPKVKKAPRVGPSNQPSTSARARLIDPGFGIYKGLALSPRL
uniref:Ubiquitin like with PHD and ring finger domains 2 n=1 Tax=Nomascus leucogenys TaxID=61853 RepID=A0A2I3HE64_NOMLE